MYKLSAIKEQFPNFVWVNCHHKYKLVPCCIQYTRPTLYPYILGLVDLPTLYSYILGLVDLPTLYPYILGLVDLPTLYPYILGLVDLPTF